MPRNHSALVALATVTLLAGGCIGPLARDSEPGPGASTQLAPARPAPTGPVTSTPLPPPGMPAPGTTDLASLGAPQAGGNVEIGRPDLLGGWTISSAGETCQLFMSLTTWTGGYRATTRGCASPALTGVSAWNLEGNQVLLLNDSGSTVARLSAVSKTQFSGQSQGGGPVSFTR